MFDTMRETGEGREKKKNNRKIPRIPPPPPPYKPFKRVALKTLRRIAPPNISSRALILGNCRKYKIKKSENRSITLKFPLYYKLAQLI